MIYPRNDVCSITVSAAHGGCGVPHVRQEGAVMWGVSCPQCSDFLRTDPNWLTVVENIPESPDEQQHREAAERNIGRRQVAAMDAAAGMLALLAGPRELLAGGPAGRAARGRPPCRKCSAAVLPAARFCGSCGAPVLREVESAAS